MSSKSKSAKSQLALFGGPKAVRSKPRDLFTWPIITDEDRRAVLDVLNRGAMSQLGVTKAFESEFAQWQGARYALAHSTGTAALEGAMFGCGIGRGDEIICQSVTYWASACRATTLGATVVFAEIDPDDALHRPERHRAPDQQAHEGHPRRALPRVSGATWTRS